MKKVYAHVFSIVIVMMLVAGCTEEKHSNITKEPNMTDGVQQQEIVEVIDNTGIENLIEDTEFQGGAMVFNATQGESIVNGKIDFGKDISNSVSKWLITQWNSKSDLTQIPGRRDGDTYFYQNDMKTVALSDDGTLTLGVNADLEYDSLRTSAYDPWVHLYLEQRYRKIKPLTSDKLNVSFDMRISEHLMQMKESEVNPDIHAAIAVFYLILADQKESGQYINFCIPLFDNRHDIPPAGWHIDNVGPTGGLTNQLIYTLDGNKIYSAPTGNGDWHNVNIDIKPYVEEALNIAKENNFLLDVNYNDLGLGSMFVGWEIPGVFKNELQIKNMMITQ